MLVNILICICASCFCTETKTNKRDLMQYAMYSTKHLGFLFPWNKRTIVLSNVCIWLWDHHSYIAWRNKGTLRDCSVRRPSVCPSVCLFDSDTFLQSYPTVWDTAGDVCSFNTVPLYWLCELAMINSSVHMQIVATSGISVSHTHTSCNILPKILFIGDIIYPVPFCYISLM